MQRQSLGGSPSSRLPQLPPSATSSPTLQLPRNRDVDVDINIDNEKAAKSPSKPRRFSVSSSSSSSLSPPSPLSPLPQQQKFIHAIPLLTLLCFLVLFFFSHDPSPSDLAEFKGFDRTTHLTDPRDDIDGRAFQDGDVVTVRSWRNLQESNKPRVNRKFADF